MGQRTVTDVGLCSRWADMPK